MLKKSYKFTKIPGNETFDRMLIASVTRNSAIGTEALMVFGRQSKLINIHRGVGEDKTKFVNETKYENHFIYA